MGEKLKADVHAFRKEVRRDAEAFGDAVAMTYSDSANKITRMFSGEKDKDEGPSSSRAPVADLASPTTASSPVNTSQQRPGTADEEWKDEPMTEADRDDPTGTTIVIEEPAKPQRNRSPGKHGKLSSGRKHTLAQVAARVPGRRRDSVRRALFSTGKSKKSKNAKDDSDEDSSAEHSGASSPARSIAELPQAQEESGRGRTTDLARSAIPASRRSSMRPPTRVASRAGSPAGTSRIRFADEAGGDAPSGGPGIVRSHSGLIHSSTPTNSPPGTSAGLDDGRQTFSTPGSPASAGSESTRVMFDLPAKPDRP